MIFMIEARCPQEKLKTGVTTPVISCKHYIASLDIKFSLELVSIKCVVLQYFSHDG